MQAPGRDSSPNAPSPLHVPPTLSSGMRRNPRHGECALCARETGLTFHHLVPKTLRRNKWFRRNRTPADFERGVMLCRPCHKAVHRFIDEKSLGRTYDTLERLRDHPEVAAFVDWVKTQDPGSRVRMR